MFKTWKTVTGAVGFVAMALGLPFFIPGLTKEQRTKLFVVEMILVAEGVVFLTVSRYIWRTVNAVFDSESRITAVSVAATGNKLRRRLALCVALGALALTHYSMVAKYFYNGHDPYYFNFVSFICLGFVVQFFLCHFSIDQVVWLIQWVWRSHIHQKRVFNMSRVRRSNFLFSACFAFVMSIYGLYQASLAPVVATVDIPITGLPRSMDRFNITVISDIHLGPTVGKAQLSQVVSIVNELNSEIVAVVGDLSESPVEYMKDTVQPLRDIKAKHGKFFVSGNHEYYTGEVDQWFAYLQSELGFTVLHNSHVNIANQFGDSFCLAGTDDIEARQMPTVGHGMDLDKAVVSCDKKSPIILLAHQPRAAKIALDSGYNIQLVLSGHTHGGQMFPMVVIAYFVNPFFAGLYRYGSGFVYVTQGAVYWGIPMRHFSNAEVTRIVLHSTEGVRLN